MYTYFWIYVGPTGINHDFKNANESDRIALSTLFVSLHKKQNQNQQSFQKQDKKHCPATGCCAGLVMRDCNK